MSASGTRPEKAASQACRRRVGRRDVPAARADETPPAHRGELLTSASARRTNNIRPVSKLTSKRPISFIALFLSHCCLFQSWGSHGEFAFCVRSESNSPQENPASQQRAIAPWRYPLRRRYNRRAYAQL